MSQAIKELMNRQLIACEISALSELQSGEISAVESYDLAIKKIRDAELIPTLETCRNAHAQRERILKDLLHDLGAAPRKGSGWWGGLAHAVESSAAWLGDRTAVAVLSAGEEYGSSQYQAHLSALGQHAWKIVHDELMPAQKKTQQTMILLTAWLHSDAARK